MPIKDVFETAGAASSPTSGVAEVGEVSFLADMTAGSKSTTGAFTVYAADGTTVKASGQITTTGTLTGNWTVEWNTSYGIRVTGVEKGGGAAGTVMVALNVPSATWDSVTWGEDDIVAQIVYGASAAPTSGAIYYGVAPAGSTTLETNDGRAFVATATAGTVAWTTNRYGNVDSDPVVSLGSSAIPSSLVYYQELRALGNRIKLGASDYVDPTTWQSTAWDGYGIGRMLITVEDDPAVERYAAAGGYAVILAAKNDDAANASSSTLQKVKFYNRSYSDETAVAAGGPTRLVDIDFTTDITDLTLTMNGGDTNLRNAADDATKAVVGAYDRVGTPTATVAITAANGGAKITSQGSAVEADMYTKLVAATEGMEFSDPSKIYMVSCRMSGQSLATDSDTAGVWISPNADFNDVNGSWGGQQYRQGAGSFRLRGIRYLAGGFGIGSDVDDDATVQDTMVVTFVLYKGRLADVFITEGSTIPSGYPTTGASLFKMDGGADAVAVDQTFNLYSTTLYVHGQLYTTAAADSVTVIERITVDEWSL